MSLVVRIVGRVYPSMCITSKCFFDLDIMAVHSTHTMSLLTPRRQIREHESHKPQLKGPHTMGTGPRPRQTICGGDCARLRSRSPRCEYVRPSRAPCDCAPSQPHHAPLQALAIIRAPACSAPHRQRLSAGSHVERPRIRACPRRHAHPSAAHAHTHGLCTHAHCHSRNNYRSGGRPRTGMPPTLRLHTTRPDSRAATPAAPRSNAHMLTPTPITPGNERAHAHSTPHIHRTRHRHPHP